MRYNHIVIIIIIIIIIIVVVVVFVVVVVVVVVVLLFDNDYADSFVSLFFFSSSLYFPFLFFFVHLTVWAPKLLPHCRKFACKVNYFELAFNYRANQIFERTIRFFW